MKSKKHKSQEPTLNPPEHPYTKYENTPLWRVVQKAIADLEENQDIQLTTRERYVVGYICKELSRERLIAANALGKLDE